MLKNGTEFVDRIDALTERKMVSMRSRTIKQTEIITVEDRINNFMEVRKKRRKRTGNEGKLNKVNEII